MAESKADLRLVYRGERWERINPPWKGRIARADDMGNIALETDGTVYQFPRTVFFRDFKIRCEARRD